MQTGLRTTQAQGLQRALLADDGMFALHAVTHAHCVVPRTVRTRPAEDTQTVIALLLSL